MNDRTADPVDRPEDCHANSLQSVTVVDGVQLHWQPASEIRKRLGDDYLPSWWVRSQSADEIPLAAKTAYPPRPAIHEAYGPEFDGLLLGRSVVFDVETTGFTSSDCIVEIGAVELVQCRATGVQFHSYVHAKTASHPMAQRVHRIPQQLLNLSPDIETVLPNFLQFVGSSVLVSHNMAFDLRMLHAEMDRLRLPLFPMGRTFCTQRMFLMRYPGRAFSLQAVCAHLRIPVFHLAHSAMVDAVLGAQVLAHLLTAPDPPTAAVDAGAGASVRRVVDDGDARASGAAVVSGVQMVAAATATEPTAPAADAAVSAAIPTGATTMADASPATVETGCGTNSRKRALPFHFFEEGRRSYEQWQGLATFTEVVLESAAEAAANEQQWRTEMDAPPLSMCQQSVVAGAAEASLPARDGETLARPSSVLDPSSEVVAGMDATEASVGVGLDATASMDETDNGDGRLASCAVDVRHASATAETTLDILTELARSADEGADAYGGSSVELIPAPLQPHAGCTSACTAAPAVAIVNSFAGQRDVHDRPARLQPALSVEQIKRLRAKGGRARW